MGDDVMTTEQCAVASLRDAYAEEPDVDLAAAIAVVLNRLAELERQAPPIGLVGLRKLIRDTAATEDAEGWSVDIDDCTCERIALAVLAYAGTGEVATEWAVRWTADDGGYEYETHPTREAAALVARRQHGVLVSREVRTGRYTAVQP